MAFSEPMALEGGRHMFGYVLNLREKGGGVGRTSSFSGHEILRLSFPWLYLATPTTVAFSSFVFSEEIFARARAQASVKGKTHLPGGTPPS